MSTRIVLEPLTLTRVGTTALYIESGDIPAGEGFLGYQVASLPASPDPSITPKRAWDDPAYRGWFVFLLAAPADPAAFAAALQQSGVLPDPARTSFAWINYDEVKGITGSNLLQVRKDAAVDVVAASAKYSFSTYGFPVFENSPIEVVRNAFEEPQRFLISYPPLPNFPVPNNRNTSLPLYERGRFTLRNEQALINDFSPSIETGFDVSFRYSALFEQKKLVNFHYPIVEVPPGGTYHLLFSVQWDPLGAKAPARTELVFKNAAYLLMTTGGKDPVSKIVPATAGEVTPTYFRTIFDEQLGLRARTSSETSNPGRFVFDTWNDGGVTKNYLTPAGEFEAMAMPATSSDAVDPNRCKLLCGLSGIESFDFALRISPTQRGDIILFTPYQPSYAPVFPLTGGGKPNELLDATYTTSYMTVYKAASNGDTAFYQSQAASSPLFHQEDADSDILAFYNAETLLLDSAAVAIPAPLAPYAGVDASSGPTLDTYTQFEAQIVSPARIQSITSVPEELRSTRLGAAPTTITTTPQGFLAEISGPDWHWVRLARSLTSAGEETQLQFENLGKDLRDALQTNEMFLVVTNPEPLGTFEKTIAIADWPFTINVGGRDPYGSYTNVLIFKFGKGTVEERAKDTASWTNPVVFTNDDAAGVSSFLQAYIFETDQLALEDPRYLPFLDLVRNPGWNGVIALRVDIQVQSFPEDIKGLLGGIDLSRFFGHHIGVNINVVRTEGGLEMTDRSSLFGLINYIAKNDAPDTTTALATRRQFATAQAVAADGTYSFRVLTLQVVFTNSEITDFNSKIILTITKWFGDTVELLGFEDDPILRNSILIFGSYENHNGIPFYTFQGTGRFRFVAKSMVLGYVEIVKAQFHTMKEEEVPATVTNPSSAFGTFSPQAGRRALEGSVRRAPFSPPRGEKVPKADEGSVAIEAEPELVRSLFSLWGYVSFLPVPDLDTLSFGNDAGDVSGATLGLYCSDIGVLMSFVLEENRQPEPEFVFDATRIGFDLTLSYARPQSLFKKFPFRVTKLESSDGDRTPTDQGYLPVITPNLKTVPLQTDFFGLYFALNLGSMGALAENAGFSAGILSAWSPSPVRASASLFMQIPGTGSGKSLLSLQSVLKLSLNRIELVEQTKGSGYYLIKLNNIGLSFLGKKLPTTGSTNLTIFGSDDVTSDSNLAWFGSYYDPRP